MINRNAYHNAMRCGTLFYYTAARRAAAPLDSAQRHSTICLLSTHCYAAHRYATRLNAAICLLSLRRSSAQRSASHLYSTICLSSAQLSYANRTSSQCYAPRPNSTICLFTPLLNDLFVTPPRCATPLGDTPHDATICLLSTRRIDTRLSAPQLSAMICLLSTLLGARKLSDTLRRAMLLNSTICLSQRSASPLGYPPRTAPRLGSTLRNDLFVHLATLRIASLRTAPRRCALRLNSPQRFVCYRRFATLRFASLRTAPQLDATLHTASLLNDLFVLDASPLCSTRQCAAKRSTTQLNVTN